MHANLKERELAVDIDAWRKAIRDDTFSRYHYEMGRAMARTADLPSAVAAYERALAISPDLCEAHRMLIDALNALDRPAEAAAAQRRAETVRADFASAADIAFGIEAYYDNRYSDAAKAFHRAVAAGDVQGAGSLGLDAVRLARGEVTDLDDIAGLPALPLRRAQEMAEMYLDVGKKMHAAGRYGPAKAALSRSLSLDPDSPEAAGYLGLTLSAEKRYDLAIPLMQQAVARNTSLSAIHTGLGIALQFCGRYEESILVLQHAVESTKDSMLHCHLGVSLYLAGRAEESLSNFDLALDPATDNFWIHSLKGLVLQKMGRLDAAEAAHRVVLRRQPQNPWALTCLGLALEAGDRKAEGAAQHRKALALSPADSWQCTNRTLTLLQEGRCDEALTWMRRTVAVDPGGIWHMANVHPSGGAALRALYAELGLSPPNGAVAQSGD